MTSSELIAADHRAGVVYRVVGADVSVVDHPEDTVAAEHAGVLAIPGGGWAYADDLRGELAVHGGLRRRAFPIAIPAEHTACDESGRYVVVTTGTGADAMPWSDVYTVVDLVDGRAVRMRSRAGEPGVGVVTDQSTGEPHVVIRHREPGAVEALSVRMCLAVGPHVPPIAGHLTEDVGADGHGDAVDTESGVFAVATGRGIERFVVDRGVPRPIGIVDWPFAGRAHYLRFDAATRSAVGVVRGGPADPGQWVDWTNHLVAVELVGGRTRVAPLPPGLAFRFGLGGSRAAVATIHPDGDALTVIGVRSDALTLERVVALPALSRPPRPGSVPWDPPAHRRSVAVHPDATSIAVTRGGDGEILVVAADADDATTIRVPTPLDDGGLLHWTGGDLDPIGR
ncbi:hypothetical protein [Gordonia sp. (in: high G+C Gram-positive bacteria)]|uniref:hypothetical protein n=1 Tax=Gordonia sp. (in: high G+C Gram-positive bacteria) TaxID=84139 RepID=UPI003F9B9624